MQAIACPGRPGLSGHYNQTQSWQYFIETNLENIKLVYTFVVYYSDIMKTLSLKLDEAVFNETEQVLHHVKKSRNRYINEALEFYNKFQKRKFIAAKLEKESELLKDESLLVLHEFEAFDYES